MVTLRLFIAYPTIVVIILIILFKNEISLCSEIDVKNNVVNALRGMDDSKIRLRKGICHISGKTVIGPESYDENISIVFDYDCGLYRFDRVDVCHTLTTPEYYYEAWYPKTKNAGVTRQSIADKKPSYLAKPFDIQMLGFFGLVGPYWLDRYQPDFRLSLLDEKPVSYMELSTDIILIETKRVPIFSGSSPLARKYWLSRKNGFSLIKADYCDGIVECDISWEKKNQVWVPKSFKLTSTQPYSAEWIIDWQSVNKEVPQHFFDPEDLAEKKTPVFSDELGESIQIGLLGVEEISPRSKVSDYQTFRYVLIILGSLLIFIGLSKKYYEWKKKK